MSGNSIFWKLCAAFAAWYFFYTFWSLRRNVIAARQSGLKYVITPVHISHKGWLATQKILLLVLSWLPESWTSSWLPLLIFDRVWHAGHTPFARIGVDTFLAVSPSRIVLWTCDADAIQQIYKRPQDFGKPIADMGMLNIHGPTVTGTEGEESRRYRRITTEAFGTKTYRETWRESIVEAGKLFKRLEAVEDKRTLSGQLERLTLNVVSQVCLGRDTEREYDDCHTTEYNRSILLKFLGKPMSNGILKKRHRMTYHEAFGTSANHMGSIYLMPRLLLMFSPLTIHRRAWRSFIEWRWYMEEMVQKHREYRRYNELNQKHNLLDVLVEARYNPERAEIPLSAVYGNIWVFILGGYHTSANTLHFIFILLAIYPGVQRVLQASLDKLLGSRPPSTWSHEYDFPILLDGPLGAVIAETVRLFGVLPFIPKSTGPRQPQSLKVGNEEYIIPANTLLLINTSAVHRNPKHWPVVEPSPEEEPPYPVSSWNPWRWLSGESDITEAVGEDAHHVGADTEQEGPKRDRGLFRPNPGTYITFSEGARQCIGKRFAQVELCAVLARVLKEGSVELVVKEEEGEKAWDLARERAVKELSRGVGFKMALELFGKVELVFVKRGAERFY